MYHHSALGRLPSLWQCNDLSTEEFHEREELLRKSVESNLTPDSQPEGIRVSPSVLSIGCKDTGQFSLLLFLKASFKLRESKYIHFFILLSNFDFILITETWLVDHYQDNAKPSAKGAASSTSENHYQLYFSAPHAEYHPRCCMAQS